MLFFLLVGFAGCASRQAPSTDVPADIASAIGVDAVEIIAEPEPLNASTTGDVLTAAEAVRLALRHDPGLQSALARVRSAAADAHQARLWPNPVLSVAVKFPEGGGKPVIEAGLAADLLAVLQQPRRADAADARLRAASAEALGVALDLLLEVQTNYSSAQAVDAELAVLNERKVLVNRLLELARSRVQLGESSQLDVLTLDSERLSLEVGIAEKRSDLRQQRLELARHIGQPSGGTSWKLPALESSVHPPGDDADLIAIALHRRPEVQSLRWELAALGDESALARWPFDSAEAGVEFERDGGWSIGPALTAPLPLFDWGQARREKAIAAIIETRHKLVQVQRQIVQEVRQAADSLQSNDASLRLVRDELIPLQQKRIEQAEAAYRNGSADITAVLIAEQESQESRQKLIELNHKLAAAQYRLQRAIGGSVFDHAKPTSRPTTQSGTSPAARN